MASVTFTGSDSFGSYSVVVNYSLYYYTNKVEFDLGEVTYTSNKNTFQSPYKGSLYISLNSGTALETYGTSGGASVYVVSGTPVTFPGNTGNVSYDITNVTVTSFNIILKGYLNSSVFGASYQSTYHGISSGSSKPVSLDTRTLTINLNGGTWSGGSTTITQFYKSTKTIGTPTRSGYNFAGWTCSVPGDWNSSQSLFSFYDNATLTANWTATSHTLSTAVNPTGYGTVSPSSATVATGATQQLTATPSNNAPGYTTTFSNWTTTATNGLSFNNANANPVTVTMGTGNGTVTANFSRAGNTYYVVFNGGDGAIGTMNPQEFTYGESDKALTTNAFTKDGYDFAHWNTKSDDTGISYSNGALVSNLAYSGNFNLYAIWERRNYTVTYNANGHGTAPIPDTKYVDIPLTLQTFIQDDVQSVTDTFTITCDGNEGEWSGGNGSATETNIDTYSQISWKNNVSGATYTSGGTYTLNEDATLYAQWQLIQSQEYTYTLPSGSPTKTKAITVIYNGNGGTFIGGGSTDEEAKSSVCDFLGWFTNPTGGIQRTSESEVSANETVYAHYSNPALGSFTTPSNCTKAEYSLVGWAESSSAQAPKYAAGIPFDPLTSQTLYAVWSKTAGLAYINGEQYRIYIYNGAWENYQAYIVNDVQGTPSWVAY